MESARWGARMGEASLVDSVVGALTDPFDKMHMGVTAENLAKSHGISREAQDEFAVESHRRAIAAIEAGRFDERDRARRGQGSARETVEFKVDEHVRRDVSREALGEAQAGVQQGRHRDGRQCLRRSTTLPRPWWSCQQNGPSNWARRSGRRILSYAVCGVEPKTMGIGPVPAVRKALERAGRTLDQVDVVELNEAFAAQALAVLKDLELDPARGQPERRRDRARTPGRGDGRNSRDQDPERDGTRGPQARARQPLHRRGPGNRNAASSATR